ncbi:MAG: GGDEF domain-containing protein [Woeseia sp.]
MKTLPREVLERLVDAAAEPIVVASTALPDWPVALCNAAFLRLSQNDAAMTRPLADIVEQLHGRDLALEISEAVRSRQEATIPVELEKREYLLVLKLLDAGRGSERQYCALYWRSNSGVHAASADEEMHFALRRARRRIRDLSRDNPVTGLLNETAFREVLAHDWAVAQREKSSLAVISFHLEYFGAYLEVFGRHATDSCLRRVAQAVRRCMRRASDVAAHITNDEGDFIVVLSHTPDEPRVLEFAERIVAAVRDLGLHHPRSKSGRFVTVRHQASVMQAGKGGTAADILDDILHA